MDQASRTQEQQLSIKELQAVGSAAAWYARYHARMIADTADDPSAAAMADRERYLDLLAGLEKLGYRLRNPITPAERDERQAA